MKASGSMLQVLKCRKNNSQRRRLLEFIGAGEGIRTLDFNLGKVALYP